MLCHLTTLLHCPRHNIAQPEPSLQALAVPAFQCFLQVTPACLYFLKHTINGFQLCHSNICREDEFLDHKGKKHGSSPAAPAAEYLQARQRVAQLMDTTGKLKQQQQQQQQQPTAAGIHAASTSIAYPCSTISDVGTTGSMCLQVQQGGPADGYAGKPALSTGIQEHPLELTACAFIYRTITCNIHDRRPFRSRHTGSIYFHSFDLLNSI